MALSVEDVIAHAVNYDPIERHNRYLKTRQLKGRRPGQAPPASTPKVGLGSRVVGDNPNSSTHVNKTRILQAESNARQVAALKGRLATLREKLKALLAEAESSSSSTKSSSSSSSESTKSSKPQTAAQKAAAKKSLEKARDARAKEQKATPDKKTTPEPKAAPTKEEQIAHLRSVISDVEAQLRAALERARTQTASNGR